MEQYTPAHILSRSLGISSLALARITSSLLVEGDDGSKTNIGLSLKFESKGMKVLGYTRKADRGWEYSRKAYELIHDYTVRNLVSDAIPFESLLWLIVHSKHSLICLPTSITAKRVCNHVMSYNASRLTSCA
jgi:hypothetical protein